MEDIDFESNLDWDPSYLASICNVDFFDMSELWKGSYYVMDSELLQMDYSKSRNVYCPEVEDISMDDDELMSAVEKIEEE